ncbi:MAG TPA: potassium-transporting ATPase subunit KdpA [Pirellulales bacterium]
MTFNTCLQLAVYLLLLLALVKPLGHYMAKVLDGRPCGLARLLGPCERLLYRLAGPDCARPMTWQAYAAAVLTFNFVGFLALYALLRLQDRLPLNPQHFPAVPADLAMNTAVSFITNTNWQSYGGESTLSYLSQMLGLGVQNFVSAATGIAVLAALVRGFRRETVGIGNFWVDLTRTTLYILLPLSLLLAIALAWQGVVQNFQPYQTAAWLQPPAAGTEPTGGQTLPMGPAASQVAIKQLGTNGGGFFNVNSAHPLENPTPLTDLLESLAILLIPAALCYTFGEMLADRRQGWAILAAMLLVFIPLLVACCWCEQQESAALAGLGLDARPSVAQSGGNMEGKELRCGIARSALWATATTAASNGSVNAMHDSFTPLGGLVPLWLIQLGEVIFGGVGSGLYGMLVFALITVFIAGLMVGRTPEYLGKKIEAFEMKMAALVILFPPAVVLIGSAVAVMTSGGRAGIFNSGPHGFSEVLYAFSSAGNNNGSAFGGLSANSPFYNFSLAAAMLVARYWLLVPTLAIAGSLAAKKTTPAGAGTLPTHTPLFVLLLAGVVILVGALTFIPALALGPVAEHMMALGQ